MGFSRATSRAFFRAEGEEEGEVFCGQREKGTVLKRNLSFRP